MDNPQLNRIDFEAGTFEANGTKYKISNTMSAERFLEFSIVESEFGVGMSLKDFIDEHIKLDEALNTLRLADACVINRNILTGVYTVKNKMPWVFRLVALAANAEGEDPKEFSEDMILRKTEDFIKSGIDINDFFKLACVLVPGFMDRWNELSRLISVRMTAENRNAGR